MKWYHVLIIIFIIVVLAYFIIPLIKYSKIRKMLLTKQRDKDNNLIYELYVAKRKEYDYVLKAENVNIYLKVLFTPSNSQICINAKETWVLSYGGSKKNKGRAYPNKRFLDELTNYLNNDIMNDDKALKAIFVYKGVEGIVRYINETELETIDIKKTPYNYKVIQFNNFDKELNCIIEEYKEK